MKIKKNGGYVVHEQLSFVFTMLELGGSYIQKYNTISKEFVPDRTITPWVLKPNLFIHDPEGRLADGEYSLYMTNVKWTLEETRQGSSTVTTLSQGTDYTVDGKTHSVTINHNVGTEAMVKVSFAADYLDKYRGQVSHFTWQKTMNTEQETEMKFHLEIDYPSKVNLSPFKNRGEFPISGQAYNSNDVLKDDLVKYQWLVYDETTKNFRAITDDDAWYVAGKDTKQIVVDQEYIQKVLLKLHATMAGDSTKTDYKATLLRRFYGQYEPDSYFETGKYLFHDTTEVIIGSKVTNRQGDIKDPASYFEIEVFYRKGPKADWQSVGYGEEVILARDYNATDHQTGILCRELSCKEPIALDDGTLLADGEAVLMAQFPTSTREVE